MDAVDAISELATEKANVLTISVDKKALDDFRALTQRSFSSADPFTDHRDSYYLKEKFVTTISYITSLTRLAPDELVSLSRVELIKLSDQAALNQIKSYWSAKSEQIHDSDGHVVNYILLAGKMCKESPLPRQPIFENDQYCLFDAAWDYSPTTQ